MFRFFKTQKAATTRELIYRTLPLRRESGNEWRNLIEDFAAISETIGGNTIAIAQESGDYEQFVAIFSHRDLLAESFENLTLTPDVLLIKKATDVQWNQAGSRAEIVIPKALVRSPKRNSWEILEDGHLRRGQIFTQERHLIAAPFRAYL